MLAAICDDDNTDRILVGKILQEKMKNRREPLTIEYFECGEDLVEKYESGKQKYDLLILDIYMKYMDGMDAAKRIRRYDRNAAIIFLTTTPDYAVESYEVRATDYLLKPVSEGAESFSGRALSEGQAEPADDKRKLRAQNRL